MRTLLIAVVFVATIRAEEPGSIDKLVEQLGSKSFPVRERASKALRERGPAVLPALRKALSSKDEEVRTRAQALIPALEIAEALLPKRVTIKLDNQPLSDALKLLETQTGYKFAWIPIAPGPPDRRTVDLKDVPLWNALDQLATKKERIACTGNGKHNLPRVANHSPHTIFHGPFRLEANHIHEDRDVDFTHNGVLGVRDHRLTLSIHVQVEPRITFTKIHPAKIKEAIDSEGKSLLEGPLPKIEGELNTSSLMTSSGRGSFRAESLTFSDVRLQRASETAKTIKLIRGTIPVQAIVIRKPVVVTAKVAEASGKTIQAGNETLTITRVNTQRGGGSIEIEVLVPYATRNTVQWHDRFTLQDDAGNVFQSNGGGSSSNGREYRISKYFSPPRNKKDVGPPTKLIFEEWIMHDYEIPFEFKDLTMP